MMRRITGQTVLSGSSFLEWTMRLLVNSWIIDNGSSYSFKDGAAVPDAEPTGCV
jgi:hypothetical protein